VTTYSPIGQPSGYDLYDSLTDLLTEGFPAGVVVEVDDGLDVVTTTIGELFAASAPPEPYTRGTATHRATTAALKPGDRVLTTDRPYYGTTDATNLRPADSKTGSLIRTVAGKTAETVAGGFHRSARRYNVQFTDGTEAANLAPVQSWHVLGAVDA
jgi:hypothetical protein